MTNLARNFRDAVIENTRCVFLGQGHFEETVTYRVNEASEPIRMKVLIGQEDGGLNDEARHMSDVRKATVLVARDPVCVKLDDSIVPWSELFPTVSFEPRIGNVFERSDGSKLSYKRVLNDDFASWTLICENHQVLRAGGRPSMM